MPPDVRNKFNQTHQDFSHVFNPRSSVYNGAVGPFEGTVNMGPTQPPQRKGHLPLYGRDKLVQLQDKFDELEEAGVFRRPEDVGISVEYVNPSFLVKKPSGGFRLVTAFADVGRYSKPQPSLIQDVDSTLRTIGQWRYIVATDLKNAFFQIPLSRQSMKYCGVATPFRGIRVYVRCAMGMPGSEAALEELMCRILGDLLKEGVVAKIADDLFIGGDSYAELLHNWRRVLTALSSCGMSLSAAKTVVNPVSTQILGWMWRQGTLQACPHRVSTLAQCALPSSVRDLWSFIGAYKVLARVIPQCAKYMFPLEDAIAGHAPGDKLTVSPDLRDAFLAAQQALSTHVTITIPTIDDQIWIITDGAVREPGIGATLYVTRGDRAHVAGFFSAKLRKHQVSWLPCEVEALCIAAAVKHFSPYIIQSSKHTIVLTDSKPCVQAYDKLCRGQFSASPRVSTFLSTASRFQTMVRHISGAANALSDFSSRNAPACEEPNCQICAFINQTEESVVRAITVEEVLQGMDKLPFTSRPAWLSIQSDCKDLRRTHAHLSQGTRPSKKMTNIKDVKRYLNVCTIGRDGLLIVRRDQPLAAARECIVVPRQVLYGLLTAIHLRLSHQTKHQLKNVMTRYFFALDMDQAIQRTTAACHQCASLLTAPKYRVEQSSEDPPDALGVTFATDIIRRARQMILILRECVTSYSVACFVVNESHDALREAIVSLCIPLVPLDGPRAVIRADPAPGFVALLNDPELHRLRIHIEMGRVKNRNKNPVAEKAVQEFERELLRIDPSGAPVSLIQLAIATANLNARIRDRGLSACEMWTQRDQFNNDQIPLSDRELIMSQSHARSKKHPYSEKSKAPLSQNPPNPAIAVGELIYLYSDGSKTKGRDRYLVTSIDGPWCDIRKFAGQQLRCTSYRVKKSECFLVPSSIPLHTPTTASHPMSPMSEEDADDNDPIPGAAPDVTPDPPPPPDIPPAIIPPTQVVLTPTTTGASATPGESSAVCPGGENMPTQLVTPNSPVAAINSLRRSARSRHPPGHLADYICK